ncbi:MAG: formyltransferase family protein [Candidatus Cloacimonetes bacterium]|jgi:phosphoribosylglycinamide formyltransferase-1|nr:phosphoribosylglycinamide formyltransferase [Candidatus Cloacimonadota bacterium]MDD2506510.1 formyltransferase family protein [Candidatus Cloacimonadota bacterium]MDD4559852.1 formyltransferase family protein [Candidatus Cloacimonadota bacterium]
MAGIAPEVQRIITLSSGKSRGSNLLALHSYFTDEQLPLVVHRAIFTSAKAPAIPLCTERGIPSVVIGAKDMAIFEAALATMVERENIALIALCGFMKQLSKDFIVNIKIPILNIHPALLPKYGGKDMYGMNVHRQVLDNHELVSGATIHRVDPLYDHGEIIAQITTDISQCHSAEEIAAKVLKVEHQIYGPAIYAEIRTHKAQNSH